MVVKSNIGVIWIFNDFIIISMWYYNGLFNFNAPGHGGIVDDGLNAIDKRYFKGEMELIGKL